MCGSAKSVSLTFEPCIVYWMRDLRAGDIFGDTAGKSDAYFSVQIRRDYRAVSEFWRVCMLQNTFGDGDIISEENI